MLLLFCRMKRTRSHYQTLPDVWSSIEVSRVTRSLFDIADILNLITASKATARMVEPFIDSYMTVLVDTNGKPQYSLRNDPFIPITEIVDVKYKAHKIESVTAKLFPLPVPRGPVLHFRRKSVERVFQIVYPTRRPLRDEDVEFVLCIQKSSIPPLFM
jgi:hypothetical protein